jgi:hypothetical protein
VKGQRHNVKGSWWYAQSCREHAPKTTGNGPGDPRPGGGQPIASTDEPQRRGTRHRSGAAARRTPRVRNTALSSATDGASTLRSKRSGRRPTSPIPPEGRWPNRVGTISGTGSPRTAPLRRGRFVSLDAIRRYPSLCVGLVERASGGARCRKEDPVTPVVGVLLRRARC